MSMARCEVWIGLTLLLMALIGCTKDKKSPEASATAAVGTGKALAPLERGLNTEPTLTMGCKASGTTPVELGSSKGSVFGFIGDDTSLYFTTWQELGSRGDLGKIRKDGGGTLALTSLQLEPRALAMDQTDLYFSEGIRLSRIAKQGGDPRIVAPSFSSQSIALDAQHVYGIPGDYGPYDRLVRVEKNGGVNYEMDTATRPEAKTGPVGYSAIVVDANGVYVTDSGNHRVLKFPLERAKPKALASGQPKAYDLAAVGDTLYFTLADKGQLMATTKSGGPVHRVATGLVPKSRIAADNAAIVATFVGEGREPPSEISLLSIPSGERKGLASVPHFDSVEAVSLDSKCVYWATRTAGSGKVTFYAVAR